LETHTLLSDNLDSDWHSPLLSDTSRTTIVRAGALDAALVPVSTHARAAWPGTTSSNPQTAPIQAIFETYLHQAPSPSDLRRSLRLLAGRGTLEQVEAQVLGSKTYFNKRAHRSKTRFLTVLAQDVLGHPLDSSHSQ
jgi:hypothetical protein